MYWISGVPTMPSAGAGGRGPGKGFCRAADVVVAEAEAEVGGGGGRRWWGGGGPLLPLWLLLRDMGRGPGGPGGVS